MQTISGRQTGERRAVWGHAGVTALLFLPIAVGLMLPWESGYQWSLAGWEAAPGRSLGLAVFLVAWVYVIHLADGLGHGWSLLALMLLAASAVGVPAAFYASEVGRRDPGLADGYLRTEAGIGLAVTFVGGALLGIDVLFEWRTRRMEQPQIP